jgi:hypothetical protein
MRSRDTSAAALVALQARLRTASEPVVVRRALKYAVVMGAVLTAINHGDAFLRHCGSTEQSKFGFTAAHTRHRAFGPGAGCLDFAQPTASPVAYAMIIGLIGYLILSCVVDFYAYSQSIVNSTSIPSIAVRLLLAGVIAWLIRQRPN